jgi:hypothetical protein
MVEIICARSGLKFEADSRRKKVHPQIAYYTSHKNYDIRYPAIEVIERGKTEGWNTIEKFEDEIQKALNPEPTVRPEYDFEGAWVAKITGSDDGQYRFNRLFLNAIDSEGRFKRYKLNGDGIYECCYKSGKGNQTRYYYQVKDGVKEQIDLEIVEKLFPALESTENQSAVEGAIRIESPNPLGNKSDVITHSNQPHTIQHVEFKDLWEDDDGITHQGHPGQDCVHSWVTYVYYLKPSTDEELASHAERVQKNQIKVEAKKVLREIYDSISAPNGAISPEKASYPNGEEIVVNQGYHQPNNLIVITEDRVWGLAYNGRDGDDWRYNNVAGAWIGSWIPLTLELKAQLAQISEALCQP